MLLALLSGDTVLARRMNRVQEGFEDCITPMLPA